MAVFNLTPATFPVSLVWFKVSAEWWRTDSQRPIAIRESIDACYTGDVVEPVEKIDKPEPRWQAVLSLLAVGGIYGALSIALIGCTEWALPGARIDMISSTH